MSKNNPWTASIASPLFELARITRQDRKPISTMRIDAELLAEMAAEQQALLVDRCDANCAAALLCSAAPVIRQGMAWIVVVGDIGYRSFLDVAKRCVAEKRWKVNHLVYDLDPEYSDARCWSMYGRTLFLVDPALLRASTADCPRKRVDLKGLFAPFIAIIDPMLSLCSLQGTWDPAWALRDLVSKLSVEQPGVPLILLTEREAISIGTERLRSALGVSGVLFADGSARARLRG